MAKQTFTTGQVLTAAQMTNLQQTAMLGGDANARTASYVLVAGDAGNAVTMSSTSATTITVNTGIFAAGDIVTIVNINSGVCTITAGTATVTTSGSLALSQNQGGILCFTSASAAIFLQFATPASGDIEGITTGANSGLTGGVTSGTADLKLNFTAKGQLPVGTGSGTTGFLTVGTNGHTLVADSAETTGLKWAAASSGMTLIKRSSFSNVAGTTTTFDGVFTSSYATYLISIETIIGGTYGDDLQLQFRDASGAITAAYYASSIKATYSSATVSNVGTSNGSAAILLGDIGTETSGPSIGCIYVQNVVTSSIKPMYHGIVYNAQSKDTGFVAGDSNNTATVTGFLLKSASSNVTGTVAVYGLAK